MAVYATNGSRESFRNICKEFVTDRLKSVHGKSVHFELQISKNFIFPHLSRFSKWQEEEYE
jgi:hypothetical protein